MIVASFGGGVNSTAMLIGMHERGERVDLILFADTGGEKPHTYAHVLEMTEWLVAHGMPPIITVSREVETLESDCLKRKALPGIAYGFKSCSDHCQYAIYTSKKMALFDCPLYGKIKRVRISTTSNRAKRSHHQK